MAYQQIVEKEYHPPPQYGSTPYAPVVTVQPTASRVYYSSRTVNANGALVLGIVTAVGCGILVPASLICSIPAVIFAALAMNNAADLEDRALQVRKSYIFSGVAVVFAILVTIAAIIYYTTEWKNEEDNN